MQSDSSCGKYDYKFLDAEVQRIIFKNSGLTLQKILNIHKKQTLNNISDLVNVTF
jgi:hypothetical protein